jgi:hypothetical protein
MMPLGLSDLPVERLADARTGKNGGMRLPDTSM